MTLSKKYKQRILILIVTASIFGIILFGGNSSSPINVVERFDLVTIDYQMWESDYAKAYDPLNPLIDETIVVIIIPITEDGLILGLYNNLIGRTQYYESGLIWLDKCVDQNRDGIDDNTGEPALSYGNSTDQYFGMHLMIQFKILDIL